MRESFDTANKFIAFAIKRWLYIWEMDLAARDKAVAASLLGKDEASKQSEARHNVKPMLDDLKAGTIEKDILDKLERIVKLMQERYVAIMIVTIKTITIRIITINIITIAAVTIAIAVTITVSITTACRVVYAC